MKGIIIVSFFAHKDIPEDTLEKVIAFGYFEESLDDTGSSSAAQNTSWLDEIILNPDGKIDIQKTSGGSSTEFRRVRASFLS